MCLEINAHSLIHILHNIRDIGNLSSEIFFRGYSVANCVKRLLELQDL